MTRATIATSLGDIVVELADEAAPLSAAQFVATAKAGLYVGGSFYRAQRQEHIHPGRDFQVIQGGLGLDGRDALPPVEHEPTSRTGLRHTTGTISFARLAPGTASSEFFICLGDAPDLDEGGPTNPDGLGFAAFGRVVDGIDVVRAIHGQPTIREAPIPVIEGQILSEPIEIVQVLIEGAS